MSDLNVRFYLAVAVAFVTGFLCQLAFQEDFTTLTSTAVTANLITFTGEGFVRKRFSASEMTAIFNDVVPSKASGYFEKHKDLVFSIDSLLTKQSSSPKPLANWLGMLPCRLFAVLDMVEWNKTYGFLNCRKLLALNNDPENQFVNATEGTQLYIFNKSEGSHWGDIHYPIEASTPGGYDLVLFGQTFEHLYDPVLCFRQLYDSMAPGGFLFTSGPHLNHLHMEPIFFSMPTPWGLALWAEMAGFKTLKIGMFGNNKYLENTIIKFKTWWPRARAYFNHSNRPQIANDPSSPGQVWILAQKPF